MSDKSLENFKMKNIVLSADTIVSHGGLLDIMTPHGEVLASLPVPEGIHAAAQFFAFVPDDCSLCVAEGLSVVPRRDRLSAQAHPSGTESGANPDFRPTSASTLERQMRFTLDKMRFESDAVSAKLRSLETIERIPQPKADSPVEAVSAAE